MPYPELSKLMATPQDQYDNAMFAFSRGDYDDTIAILQGLLAQDPSHFEAQLALGMAYYRKGDYQTAIIEGHKAEKLKPNEQLVHTNLSLFYMKSGDKQTAEHHGLQARIASWKGNMVPPTTESQGDPELQIATPQTSAAKVPEQFPDMPWKKNRPLSNPNPPPPTAENSLNFVSVLDPKSLPPGKGRTVNVHGQEFAVYNVDGHFYAIEDACPHRGGPLGAGTLEEGHVCCPLHGWAFDPKTGACRERPDRPVKTFPTRIQEAQVQIGLPSGTGSRDDSSVIRNP